MDYVIDHYVSLWILNLLFHTSAIVVSCFLAGKMARAAVLVAVTVTAAGFCVLELLMGYSAGQQTNQMLGWIWGFVTLIWGFVTVKQFRKALAKQEPNNGGSSCGPGGNY